MNASSLKHSLAHWSGFPSIERTFGPGRTREAAVQVEKLFGDVPPRAPAPYDLQALHRRVVETWRRDRSLARLAPRDQQRLPWILFYPAHKESGTGDGDTTGVRDDDLFRPPAGTGTRVADWMGAEPAVVREYGRWLATGRRTRSVLTLLHEFLRVYPVALPTFNELRGLLQRALEGSPSPLPASLRLWRQRCKDFGLLDEGGAGTFVQKLISSTDSLEEVLRRAGLDAGLAHCGLLEAGIRARLPHAELLLRDGRLGDAQLDRLLTLLEEPMRKDDERARDRGLRFDDRATRLAIATALLRPFAERHPEATTRERLQPFFLRHFGDPRLRSGKHRWPDVPSPIRLVVIRWLNERALEQFLLLVKETAKEGHWRYREAFWRAFVPVASDISVVLGRQAEFRLRRLNAESDEPEPAATLRGAQSEQSVLLLRLPGVTIADWSHNGACRFWLGDNLHAPTLHDRQEYSASELMSGANESLRHDGSPVGRWQDKFMGWLRENTGIEIDRADYFPDRLRERHRVHRFQHTSTDLGSRSHVLAGSSPGEQPQTVRTETVALLQGVRNAVMGTNRLRVDLRDFMRTGSAAWMAYKKDHGTPGYKTRRQTVLDRLDSTITRLRSP